MTASFHCRLLQCLCHWHNPAGITINSASLHRRGLTDDESAVEKKAISRERNARGPQRPGGTKILTHESTPFTPSVTAMVPDAFSFLIHKHAENKECWSQDRAFGDTTDSRGMGVHDDCYTMTSLLRIHIADGKRDSAKREKCLLMKITDGYHPDAIQLSKAHSQCCAPLQRHSKYTCFIRF
ncbi:uncharacterized protein LOC143476983 [Brachyhypopomus gauderio]|uniref:uncharacterized protein LOC143476983 n=1 Tax=Brachyhypopomus gauderio TaxID=698409 RepID=UPI00404355A1